MQVIKNMYKLQKAEQKIIEIDNIILKNDASWSKKAKQLNLEGLKESIKNLRLKMDENKKELRLAELDLSTAEADKKKYEAKMYDGSVVNTKELQKIESKIALAKDNMDKAENKAVELMEELEADKEKEEQLLQKEKEYQEIEQKTYQKYQEAQNKLKEQKDSLLEKKEKILSELDDKAKNDYSKLQERFKGEGIALYENNVCQGCHLELSLSFKKNSKPKETMCYCENCHRLLLQKD